MKQHSEFSSKDLQYFDESANEKYFPYVIEPSLGVQRSALIFLCDSYEEEVTDGETRVVLRLHNQLAPIKIAVLPLSKKLSEPAEKIYEMLTRELNLNIDFDQVGSIGKRYRRYDEIGTPYCVTFDFDSLEDNSVTIRERDSMEQSRINISELSSYFRKAFIY